MRKRIHLFTLLTCAAALANAQATRAGDAPSSAELQQAAAAFARADWSAARAAYEAIATAHPQHALSRFRLGVARLELGETEQAERDLRQGERLGVTPAQSAYRLAQLFAVRGS